MTSDKHLGFIDQLRGIAILLVAGGHILGYADVHYPAPFASDQPSRSLQSITGFILTSVFCNGLLGVLLFFVLSGFCIRWSQLHAGSRQLGDFYLRRTFRIYPAYLVWLAFFAIMTAAPYADILGHVLLLHNFSISSFHSINPPFWSIALEWQIYLMYPLILWCSRKLDQRTVLTATALIAILSGILATTTFRRWCHSDLPLLVSQLPTSLLFPWMLGFYQAERLHSGRSLKTVGWGWWIALVFIALVIESYPKIHFLRVVGGALVASQLLALCHARRDKLTARPFMALAFIGTVSYSIYLGHDVVAYFYPAIERTLSVPASGFHAGLIAISVCLPLMILIGWISYQLFEKPGIHLGKMIRQRLMPSPPVVSREA